MSGIPDLPPEQIAHMADGGPAQTVAQWLASVVDRADLGSVWMITDESLRRALVQTWVLNESVAGPEDRDDLTDELVRSTGHPAWRAFEDHRVGRWREITFADFVAQGWGVVSVPELLAWDLEYVRVAAGAEERSFEAGESFVAQTFVVRLVDGEWRIAGIGRALPVPGWPPTERVVPSDMGPPPSA